MDINKSMLEDFDSDAEKASRASISGEELWKIYAESLQQPNASETNICKSSKKETTHKDNISPLKKLTNLSATKRVESMKQNLGNDDYVFDGLALAGQITLFYAMYNTGKTLFFMHFLIQAIKEGRINPADVFYINADDDYKGLLTKTEIAAKYGFHMISPSESGVSSAEIMRMIKDLAQTDDAKGKVIVLDTLKKFVDMMNKSAQSSFFKVLRDVVAKNASVIIAGHCNKHKSIDGKLIYEGTSDTMSDIDCSYAVYRISGNDDEKQMVEFRLDKSRGDMRTKATFSYEKVYGLGYEQMLESIKEVDNKQAAKYSQTMQKDEYKSKHESEYLFIKGLLGNGEMNQSSIINEYAKEKNPITNEFSKTKLIATLKELDEHSWFSRRIPSEGNALVYRLQKFDIYDKGK